MELKHFLIDGYLILCSSKCTDYPPALSNFLLKKQIYFSSVAITNDRTVMQRTWGFKIPADYHTDLQHRYQKDGQVKTGMPTMAADLIDLHYATMKTNFHHKRHGYWDVIPLPGVNIDYAAVDGFVSYELNRLLDLYEKGTSHSRLGAAKKKKKRSSSSEDDSDDNYVGFMFCGTAGSSSTTNIDDGCRWNIRGTACSSKNAYGTAEPWVNSDGGGSRWGAETL